MYGAFGAASGAGRAKPIEGNCVEVLVGFLKEGRKGRMGFNGILYGLKACTFGEENVRVEDWAGSA